MNELPEEEQKALDELWEEIHGYVDACISKYTFQADKEEAENRISIAIKNYGKMHSRYYYE